MGKDSGVLDGNDDWLIIQEIIQAFLFISADGHNSNRRNENNRYVSKISN